MNKLYIVILAVFNMISCNDQVKNKTKPKIDGRIIVEKLDSLDFFDITDSTKIKEVKQSIVDSYNKLNYFGSYMYDDTLAFADNRFYVVDAEELFEIGGLTEYLDAVKPFFTKNNLPFEYSKENNHEELTNKKPNYWLHTIEINDKEYKAFDGDMDDYSWATAFINFATILNAELERQQSNERVYLIYSDNDGQIVFLTNEMYDLVKRYYAKGKDRPMSVKEWKEFYEYKD